MDQINGYLETSSDAERNLPSGEAARPWKDTLKDGIQEFLDNPNAVGGVWTLRNNPKPGPDLVRQSQNEWGLAEQIAKRAGVDVAMLISSAEYMKANADHPIHGQEIGRTALAVVKRNPLEDF
jgi:hypothetical protein